MAAIVAAVLSVAMHVVMLAKLPPLPMGRVLDRTPWQDFRAIELGEVLRGTRSGERPPARFRPENPQDIARVYGQADVEAATAAAPLPVPEAPVTSMGPVMGESQALLEPGALGAPAAWDPREEIVAIDRATFDEEISSLPRRYVEQVERTDRVPDVVLPVERPVDLVSALQDEGPPGIESASRPTMRDEGMGTGHRSRTSSSQGPVIPITNDFLVDVAAVKEAADVEETAAASNRAVDAYLDLDVRAFRAEDEDGAVYFELNIRRHGDASLPVLPKDVVLLQDCSESMTPSKLAECKRGLRRWLDLLGPDDRFEIIGFRASVVHCFDGLRAPTKANRAQALQFIDELRAIGNTDVYGSLQAALALPREADRPLIVALVTDGRPTTGVTGSSDIIERFTRENGSAISMFALGGGRKVNRFLLDLLSYRNRGDSLVVEDEAAIPSAMERWGLALARPVLTDLRYRFTGVDTADVYPRTLTHLYLDRPLVLYGRATKGAGPAAFQIVGRSGASERDIVFPLDLGAAQPGGAELRLRWAWHRVYQTIGDYNERPDPAVLQQLRAFADRYGLVVPYGFGSAVPRE